MQVAGEEDEESKRLRDGETKRTRNLELGTWNLKP